MVLFDSLLRSTLCVTGFFCLALQLSKSEIGEDKNNSSRSHPHLMRLLRSVVYDINDHSEIEGSANDTQEERVVPTPLIMHLNRSTAELLMEEANSMFVSNTSFSDFANDNETHQMLLRNRERKRQTRILTIQQEILQKLGLERGPNVTARFSAEERQDLLRTVIINGDRNIGNETVCTGDTEDDDTC